MGVGLLVLSGFAVWGLSAYVTGQWTGSVVLMVELAATYTLAVANGGNDIANAVGTSVGAKALTMQQALGFGATFEFAGAMLLGALVSKTISKGVIEPTEFASEPSLFATLMFSVVVGAALTTLLATIYGFPISATHGIVSGLVAVGWYAKGYHCIGWDAFLKTVVMWILSPIAGLIAAFGIQLMCTRILKLDLKDWRTNAVMPTLWSATLTVTCLFMFGTGPEAIRIEPAYLAILASIGTGVGITSLLYLYDFLTKYHSKPQQPVGYGSMENKDGRLLPLTQYLRGNGRVGLEEGEYKQDGWEAQFVGLLVLSALTVAFAHGANDVGNAVGPLAVMGEVYSKNTVHDEPTVPIWCLSVGAVGFVVGILCLGKYTVNTVGKKIIKLTPSRSYSTQMGAAIAVLLSSVLGMPVSTSHCLVGSVLGVGLAQAFVASITGEDPPHINISILNKIVIGWAVTIPLAMFVSLIAFAIARPHSNAFSSLT